MGEALLTRRGGSGGSGEIINGIIEEYYAATEDINSNTFVEFVGDNTSIGELSTVLSEDTNSIRFAAEQVSENTWIVATLRSYANTDSPVTVRLVKEINGVITFLPETVVATSRQFSYPNYLLNIDIAKFTDGYFLVSVNNNPVMTNQAAHIYSWVVKVTEENSIAVGSMDTSGSGDTANSQSYVFALESLGNGGIVVASDYSSHMAIGNRVATQDPSNPMKIVWKGASIYLNTQSQSYMDYSNSKEIIMKSLPGNKFVLLTPTTNAYYAQYSSNAFELKVFSCDPENNYSVQLLATTPLPEGNNVVTLRGFNIIALTETKFLMSYIQYTLSMSVSIDDAYFGRIVEFNPETNKFDLGDLMKLTAVKAKHTGYGSVSEKNISLVKINEHHLMALFNGGVVASASVYNYTYYIQDIFVSGKNIYCGTPTLINSALTKPANTARRGVITYFKKGSKFAALFSVVSSPYSWYSCTFNVGEEKIKPCSSGFAGLLTTSATATTKGKVLIPK